MLHQCWHQKLKGCHQHWAHTSAMSLTLAAQLPHPIHQLKATTAVTSTASYRADAPARPQPPGDRQVGLTVPLRFAGRANSAPQIRRLRGSGRSSGCLRGRLDTLPTLRFRQETLGAEGRQPEWETLAGYQMSPPFWVWLFVTESVRLLYSLSTQALRALLHWVSQQAWRLEQTRQN